MTRYNHVAATRAVSSPKRRRGVPVAPGTVTGEVAYNGAPDCQWVRAAAEMAGMGRGTSPLPHGTGTMAAACSPVIATHTLGMDAEAVGAGREFFLATLRDWGVTQRREEIAVVVSELLTNALRHAVPTLSRNRRGWPVQLGLLRSGPCVLCAVADPSSSVPVPQKVSLLAETGRGLHVVGALSDKWGYTIYSTPTDLGKVVWAIFVLPSPRASHDHA